MNGTEDLFKERNIIPHERFMYVLAYFRMSRTLLKVVESKSEPEPQ